MKSKIKEFNYNDISLLMKYQNDQLKIIVCDLHFKVNKNLTQQFSDVIVEIMKELSNTNISKTQVIIKLFLIYHKLHRFTPLDDFKNNFLFIYKDNNNIYLDYHDGFNLLRCKLLRKEGNSRLNKFPNQNVDN